MARRPRKPQSISNPLFDIEDNAPEIFKKFLEDDKIAPKDVDLDELPSSHGSAVTRKKGDALHKVDLHGLSLRQAKDVVDAAISRLCGEGGTGRDVRLRIITGKGKHSAGGRGVLVEEIHAYVAKTYAHLIRKLDESPSRLVLKGQPIRGHFDLTLRV